MYQFHCLNPIASKGLDIFDENYRKSDTMEDCNAILVRSAKMHDMQLPSSVSVIARAGAGVNNIPVKECAEKGIVVFNTPGANANGVKELVLAGMLLASRDIVGGIEWVQKEKDKEDIDKLAEKQKKQFAGCEIMGKKGTRVINCHLGNGSSVSASIDGKCVDTSMGLTPLEGLPMGTRSGNLDPAILQFIMNKYGYTADEMLNILNKKSGVLGISGVGSDFRDLEKAAKEGNERAQLALDKFAYEVRKYIGSYAAAMGGVDIITFTAGVGENGPDMRESICEGLGFLGVHVDHEKNQVRGKETDISAADSTVKVYVIPTNEELMIARDTLALVTK